MAKKVKRPADPDIQEGKRLRTLINDVADAYEEEMLLADGFDAAIIGYVTPIEGSDAKVVYDWQKCVEILMKDMSEEDALEHMSFNVTGGYLGPHTPLFIKLI